MQNENIKNLEPVVEIKNSNQIQEQLTDTTLPTQPQKQRAYSSTNIPLEFEPDDDIDAIMEKFNNLSDEEQTQTKREICEYYGDKFPTQRETHRIHTPDFIYITGDKEKDEQKLQNILSRCHGSLAKRPNSTITVQEFKRRFLLEREAHKEFYGSNPYINALNDAMIQSSILDKVQNSDLYNSPETIELAQRLNYKMAYEDPNLKPFQYALNTITPTITTTPTLTDAVVDNEVKTPEEYENNYDYLLENLHLNKDFKKEIIEYEGNYNFPYLDTRGLITWGIGFNLLGKLNYNPNEEETLKKKEFEAIKALKPIIRNTNRLATDKEIWQAVENISKERTNAYKEYKKNHPNDEFFFNIPAHSFETTTNLRFKQTTLNKEYISKLKNTLKLIQTGMNAHNKKALSNADYTAIPDIKNLPIPVYMALIDIAYNSGYGGWKNLNNALAKKDYITAAKESHRKDDNGKNKNAVKRNKITHQKFLDIAKNH